MGSYRRMNSRREHYENEIINQLGSISLNKNHNDRYKPRRPSIERYQAPKNSEIDECNSLTNESHNSPPIIEDDAGYSYPKSDHNNVTNGSPYNKNHLVSKESNSPQDVKKRHNKRPGLQRNYMNNTPNKNNKLLDNNVDNSKFEYIANTYSPKNDSDCNVKKSRNTENFNPSFEPPQMRIICATPGLKQYNREYSDRDVLVVRDLFCDENDLTIYDRILEEINTSGIKPDDLWKLWHGDTHLIADDKLDWKKHCPVFNSILDKIVDYFGMDIKATRFNLYRNSTEWKPFHHDAAALNPEKAKNQNVTVACSFGLEREVAFEHDKTRITISIPLPNGTMYCFGKDVNMLWRHGIPQIHPSKNSDQGRISIVAWGHVPSKKLL